MPPLLPTLDCSTIDLPERRVIAGLLQPEDRVALIGGELIDLVPIGWPHQACSNRLAELFGRFVSGLAIPPR